jgi:hypothetical protein
VACSDDATGSGYLLYSAESVHTRFATNPPHADNADHFICVKYVSGQWKYDNNIDYYAFTPEEGDILMASINFDTDVIISLAGQPADHAEGCLSGISYSSTITPLALLGWIKTYFFPSAPNRGSSLIN